MDKFVVLGLVGPAGSGKDLVADWLVKNKGFIKVSFADPMKRFVLRTFPGITVEQLWGPSEERNRMFDVSEMWWFEAIGHFGIGAQEIVQDVLEDSNRVPAYLQLYDWFTWLRRTYPNKLSARIILQTLGTEWGRNVDPLLWARYAHKVANTLRLGDRYNQAGDPPLPGLTIGALNRPGVVIPDHRFKNEIELTQANGGYVVRLIRTSLRGSGGNVGIQGHSSETEMRDIPGDAFDFDLVLEEGLDKVEWALQAFTESRAWEIKRNANHPTPS